MPFRALKLGYPNVVECELASRMHTETVPKTSRIRFEFPERDGLPPLKFWWYEGNPRDAMKPLRPDADVTREIIQTMGTLPVSGAVIVGDQARFFSPDDNGERFFVAMKGQDEMVAGDKHEACKAVPQSIPRAPGHMEAGTIAGVVRIAVAGLCAGRGDLEADETVHKPRRLAGGGPGRCNKRRQNRPR